MKRFLLLWLFACCVSLVFAQRNDKQIVRNFKMEITMEVNINYLVYLPEDYNGQESWPLMIFLHGAGERGSNIEKVKVHGPPKIVEEKEMPFIIVSPQCPAEQWWKAGELNLLLDEVIETYKVDTERIYLTGISMGGFGTWAWAAEHPDRFAAIAPICGGGEPRMANSLAGIPAWVFHGAKDRVVPLTSSSEMVDALRKVDADVKFTVYPEAGHDSWTETYDNPELYEWFLSHTKNND